MKTQTMDLAATGVKPMGVLEMQQVDGGGWAEVITWLATQVVANWADVKKGASAGWNSVHYN